jgi:type IV pilus assembly protein PilZ
MINKQDAVAAIDCANILPKAEFSLHITNKKELHMRFMPFVKGSGMFVHTDQQFNLGDFLRLRLKLLDMAEDFEVLGQVVWINPKHAQGNSPEGVGIQFINQASRVVQDKIKNTLADYVSTDSNATM